MKLRWLNALMLLALLTGIVPSAAFAASPTGELPAPVAQDKPDLEIEPELAAQLASDEAAGYMIDFREQADLSPAYQMDWDARGEFVVAALQKTAARSQANVRAFLDARGVDYTAFWIDNVIVVASSSRATVNGLAAFEEIEALRALRTMGIIEPETSAGTHATTAVEPNIAHVLADQVWGMGYRGEGMVVANIDTGVRYTHETLVRQYRGTATGSHDYNWLGAANGDAIPTDDHGHGTHTMGTMVGEDASQTNQIGMAPDAQWIACDGCTASSGCPGDALLACAQWVAAPYPVGDPDSPDPSKRPNVVNNSWGDCGRSYDGWYQASVDAWHAAGIYPIFSNGNAGNCGYSYPPGLNTVGNPARYGNVTGVGSTGQSNGQYATHSNWGPTDNPDTVNAKPGAEDLKPQVLAPGVGIRSSLNGSDSAYGSWGGTSMSAPHVSGLIALMWQAAPCLVGDYATTETIIEDTAVPIPYDDGTGGGAHVPNYATGWGEINAAAAVQEALQRCGDSTLTGQVTDQATSDPIPGALVVASASLTETWQTTTNDQGLYALNVYSGTYTLEASKYGYQASTISGVVATTDMTTTQDIALTPAAMYEVSGTVTDATTGWPLYASIDIAGYPGDPVWSDPVTGYYSVELAEDSMYTLTVGAWVPGYEQDTASVGPLATDVTRDFALMADLAACEAPGYRTVVDPVPLLSESFDAGIPVSWSVVNNGGTCVWVDNDPGGRGNQTGGADAFAIIDTDACGMGTTSDTDMQTPGMDTSAYDAIWIEYKNDYYDLGSTAELMVYDGADWVTVEDMSGNSSRGPETRLVAGPAGSAATQVSWHYAGGWDWWWQVDDVVVHGVTCEAPTDGSLVVGNVYDANLGDPLPGAEVASDLGEVVMVSDPDAFYTVFATSGSHTLTATLPGFTQDVAVLTVPTGDTVRQDFFLGAGYLEATPAGVEVAVEAGTSLKQYLTLDNLGTIDAAFELLEVPGGYLPMATSMAGTPSVRGSGGIDLSVAGGAGVQAEPWGPSGPIELILDDGSAEDAIGLTAGGQFIWLNRFTPEPADYPFTLDQVSVLFRDSAVVGEAIEIVVWEDTDEDGDPGTGAVVRTVEYGTVQANDGATWSVYNLASPVFFAGPGDVLIGAVNRDATGTHPAAIDTDASQGRSWVGIYSGDPPDPPTLPPDADWGVIDDMGFPGNWMIRGSGVKGSTGDPIPWLAETPISGTVASGAGQSIMLTLDAGVPEASQPGTYYGALQVSTDTPYPAARVPVTMTVLPPGSWGKLVGTVSSMGYCDAESNPLEEAEVTVESNTGATWTLLTDAAGEYSLWLDAVYNPLTVTATFSDHVHAVAPSIVVTGGMTTTADLDLRWLMPCVGADPVPLEQTVELGYTATVPLTLTNWGAAGATFSLGEQNGGFATTAIRTVTIGDPVGDNTWSANPAPSYGVAQPWSKPVMPDGAVWLTHSLAQTIQELNSVSCNAGGLHADNSYLRVFDLAAFGVTTDLEIVEVDVGVESAAGAGGAQPVEVRLYTLAGSEPPTWAAMTLIGSASTTVPDQTLSHFTIPVSAIAPAGSVLVVEFFTPNGQTAGHSLFVGSNNLGQTGPSYLAAADCGVPEPADTASIGFPDMHIVMNVTGMTGSGGDIPWLAEDPAVGAIPADSETVVDVTFDASAAITQVTQPGRYFGTLHVASDDPVMGSQAIPVTMTVTAPGTWGKLTGTVTSLGYCDSDPSAVESANVVIEAVDGMTWTLATDDAGLYTVWVDEAHSPVTVTVSAPEHETGVVTDVAVVGGATTTTDFALQWLVPCVSTAPDTLEATVTLGLTATVPFSVTNAGAVPAGFELVEENTGLQVNAPPLAAIEASKVVWNQRRLEGECAVYQDSILTEPPEAASCYDYVPDPQVFGGSILGPTDNGYAQDIGYISDNFVTFPLADFPGQVVLGTSAQVYYAMDFAPDAATLYALNETTGQLGTLDLADGSFTGLVAVPAPVDIWTGLTIDPMTGEFYVADATNLYTLDPTTGATSLVGPFGTSLMIDIAMNTHGELYGHDIGTDSIYRIDPSTGAATLVGPTGYNANYAQGMDFDNEDGTLYIFLYQGGGANVYGTVDLATGAVTPLAVSSPQGEFEGATRTANLDIPWLSEDPITGTVGTGITVPVEVTFDAGVAEITQPGEYHATLFTQSDDPVDDRIPTPVTMTVVPPATWGAVNGTVYSLGYCDAESNPVEGADIVIENGTVVTLTTGSDGTYSYWLPPGTYTVTVTAPDHTGGVASVTVSSGVSTTQDFSLRWLEPCVAVSPDAIDDTLAMGQNADHVLALDNTGAGTASFTFLEYGEEYLVTADVVASAPVGMRRVAIGDLAVSRDPSAVAGVSSSPTAAPARPQGIFALTHSLSQVVMSGNSVACGAGGLHADNSYIRVFDLTSFGITDYFDVQEVEVGIETATAGAGGTQPGVVNLYTLTGPLTWANMTLIGTADVAVADQSLALISVPVTGTAPAGSLLVVEFFTPDGQGDGHSLYVGSNNMGQTAPTYLAADACGVSEPTDVAAIGFPGMHLVMNVIGYTPEPVDLLWLSEDPDTGTVAADGTDQITVTLDAARVPAPGTYHGTLVVETNDPVEPHYPVAVAMTVTLPSTYGAIQGTVYSTGYCDGEMDPVGGAAVMVEGSDGMTITLTTDAAGAYEVWRDEATSPYTVTAMAPDHWEAVATGVVVTGTETTVRDLRLRSMQPCIGVQPAELTAEVSMGMSTTTYMTVANTGGYDLNWSLSEGDAGFVTMAGEDILVVDDDDASATALETSLTNLGYTWMEASVSGFGAMSVAELLEYQAVFIAGGWNIDTEDAQMMAYLDAGGSLFIADNDLGYQYSGGGAFFNTYLQSTYVSDGGSDGVAVGGDIMAGLDPDISADPYPDDVIVGPEGVEIFTAVSGNSAGVRVERAGYKAVYLAWEFEFTGPLADLVVERAADWLTGGGDVTWLSEDPESGIVAMDSTSAITVTFDAGVPEVTQPGTYTTTLTVESDDPMYPEIALPVTMTVLPPATWGNLEGTVTGLGYCDTSPMPLEDAIVFIESGAAMSWTVQTDADGMYDLWLDEAYSPLTVTISYEAGYEAQMVSGVTVVSGTVTTLDADLRWLQPCVTTDSGVAVTVQMGNTDAYTLTLTNNGAVDTSYGLTEVDRGFMVAGANAIADTFGYVVADSNDGFGPVYDFVDILGTGSPIPLGDDDFAGPVALGFEFPFYGADAAAPNLYDEVFVNSNGFLSFGAGSTDLSNDVLPDLMTPNNIIALMWDDLVGGEAYAYTFDMCPYGGGECAVVQYEGFTHMDGSDAGTWQVILFDTGSILVQFEDAGAYAGASSTTGIENEYGTDGTTYAANTPALEDKLAVCFAFPGNDPSCVAYDVSWLDEDAPTGDILADDATDVTLSVDASLPETSQPGTYMAALELATGDPVNPLQVIPVTMTVEAPATWGKIDGSVIGWNHCDMAAFPMEDALVYIESSNGTDDWAITTDVSGTYGIWLDAAHAPLTVTVNFDGYVEVVEVVSVAAGSTTEVLHELRSDMPCFAMDAYAIEFTVTKGHTHTESMMLSNLGAGMLEISDVYGDGWMTPDMTSGMIYPDGEHPMDILFSAASMALGDHVGEMVVVSNDPMMPMMTVPVTMTVVTPTVIIDVYATPPSVTHPGAEILYTIVVTNTSDGPVSIELTNTIPVSTTYVEGSVTGGLDYIEPTTGDDYVTWTGETTPGVPLTFTFAVLVDAQVTGGTIDDLVTVTTEDDTFTDTESLLVGFYRFHFPVVSKGAP